MRRALLGLFKGIVVGGAIGFGLLKLEWTGSLWAYVACALVGAIVGVVCGRPPWKSETIWTPVVKLIVGAIIGSGLCALGQWLGGKSDFTLNVQGVKVALTSGSFLAPVVGILYGLFVEIDDGGKADKDNQKDAKEPAKLDAPRRK